MLPLNPGHIIILECHRPVIPNRTEYKTRSKQRCFILHFPSSEYFTSQGFLETMFLDLTTPLEMCSMNELPKEEGGLDTCIAEGKNVHALGFSGDHDTLPARWLSLHRAGWGHRHLLAPVQGQLCRIPAGYCYISTLS